jgi:tetratricopeptide (TPR) repeat protein
MPRGEAAAAEEVAAPDEERKAAAKEAFLGARAAYKEKRYQEALDGFQAAYRADPRPEMLYNIGLCQFKLGQLEAARDTFRSFLEEKPDSKARPKVEEKLAEIEEQLPGEAAQEEEQPAEPAPPVDYKRKGLQVLADLGIGGVTSNSSYTPSLGIGAAVQHRVLPYLAYGARLTWSAVGTGSSSSVSWYFEGAAHAEFYPLPLFLENSRWDPWVSLGVGVGHFQDGGSGYSGPSLHMGLGLHIFLRNWVGLGPALRYMHGFWVNSSSSSGMFFIGAEAAFHFL